jgi:hypothetical protein
MAKIIFRALTSHLFNYSVCYRCGNAAWLASTAIVSIVTALSQPLYIILYSSKAARERMALLFKLAFPFIS